MKKITLTLVLGLAALFVSCEESNEIEVIKPTVAASINVPEWLVGDWALESVGIDNTQIKGFSFYSDDICRVLLNDEKLCYKSRIIEYNNAQLVNWVDETIIERTDTIIFDAKYGIDMKLHKQNIHYRFEQVETDSLKLRWIIPYPDSLDVVKHTFYLDRVEE